jgi:CII-binding regulator of phage lambda lysogenization HflD
MTELDEAVQLENLQQVVKTLRDGLGPITTAYLATKVLTLEAKLTVAEKRIAVLEKRVDQASQAFCQLSSREKHLASRIAALQNGKPE